MGDQLDDDFVHTNVLARIRTHAGTLPDLKASPNRLATTSQYQIKLAVVIASNSVSLLFESNKVLRVQRDVIDDVVIELQPLMRVNSMYNSSHTLASRTEPNGVTTALGLPLGTSLDQ